MHTLPYPIQIQSQEGAKRVCRRELGQVGVHTSFQGFPRTVQILARLDPSHVPIPPAFLTSSFALFRSSIADWSSSTSEGRSALYLTNTPPSLTLFSHLRNHCTLLSHARPRSFTNRGSIARTSNPSICTFLRVSDNRPTSLSCWYLAI